MLVFLDIIWKFGNIFVVVEILLRGLKMSNEITFPGILTEDNSFKAP